MRINNFHFITIFSQMISFKKLNNKYSLKKCSRDQGPQDGSYNKVFVLVTYSEFKFGMLLIFHCVT